MNPLLVLLVLGGAAGLLYGSQLHDPLLFDSIQWFGERNLGALGSLGSSDRLVSRLVAYWLYQGSGGRHEILRLASLGLHVGTAYVLFLLVRRLLPLMPEGAHRRPAPSGNGAAIALAGLFMVHPVQVYAVAYHGQLEIVLATFLGMLMLLAYLEGLERSSRGLLLLSVLLYLLAVLSKETLLGMPAVALAMTLLLRRPSRALARALWPYFGLCALIAAAVVVRELGQARPATDLGGMARVAVNLGDGQLHARSIVTQGFIFFRYLALWLVPDVRSMSIDLQYPLAGAPLAWPESAGFAAFCLYPIAASWLLLRRGRAGLVGLGLLWPWLLFLPELAATRTTEAFVLYRSYPWIGGVLLALVVALAPRLGRAAGPLAGVACLGLAVLAHERLATFRSAQAMWNDAVEKNRPYERRAPGASRAYLNRGDALLAGGRPEAALSDFARALELTPGLPYASLNEGLAYIRLGRYREALRALDEGLASAGDMPDHARAAAYSNRAGLYLLLARPRDAVEDLARAAALDPARPDYRANLDRLREELGRKGSR